LSLVGVFNARSSAAASISFIASFSEEDEEEEAREAETGGWRCGVRRDVGSSLPRWGGRSDPEEDRDRNFSFGPFSEDDRSLCALEVILGKLNKDKEQKKAQREGKE
jgi:hypothetical protein